jgi:hypothetical protein
MQQTTLSCPAAAWLRISPGEPLQKRSFPSDRPCKVFTKLDISSRRQLRVALPEGSRPLARA